MMREVLTASLAVWILGCGSSVMTGTGGSTPTGTTPTTVVTGSGPGCPSVAPGSYQTCTTEGLSCTYTTGACVLSYTCQAITYSPDNPFACGPSVGWIETQQTECDGCAGSASCVPCSMAKQGDPCDAVDYSCQGEGGGNCAMLMTCQADHTWSNVEEPGCCI